MKCELKTNTRKRSALEIKKNGVCATLLTDKVKLHAPCTNKRLQPNKEA